MKPKNYQRSVKQAILALITLRFTQGMNLLSQERLQELVWSLILKSQIDLSKVLIAAKIVNPILSLHRKKYKVLEKFHLRNSHNKNSLVLPKRSWRHLYLLITQNLNISFQAIFLKQMPAETRMNFLRPWMIIVDQFRERPHIKKVLKTAVQSSKC